MRRPWSEQDHRQRDEGSAGSTDLHRDGSAPLVTVGMSLDIGRTHSERLLQAIVFNRSRDLRNGDIAEICDTFTRRGARTLPRNGIVVNGILAEHHRIRHRCANPDALAVRGELRQRYRHTNGGAILSRLVVWRTGPRDLMTRVRLHLRSSRQHVRSLTNRRWASPHRQSAFSADATAAFCPLSPLGRTR